MKKLACALLLLLFSLPQTALADAKGDRYLRKMDQHVNKYQGLYLKWTLYVKNPGKTSRIKYTTWTRNDEKRLIKMTYPGDIKGMHILIQSRSVMYIYLPAFRKVRRIAGHVRNQGFMGSGFNYDDMATAKWAPYYTARFVKENRKYATLDLQLRPGKPLVFKRIRLTLRKDYWVMHKIRFLSRRGKVVKTMYYGNYKCRPDNSHCSPMLIGMIEHTRGNLVSEMRCTRIEWKSSLRDRMFTVRHLIRSAN